MQALFGGGKKPQAGAKNPAEAREQRLAALAKQIHTQEQQVARLREQVRKLEAEQPKTEPEPEPEPEPEDGDPDYSSEGSLDDDDLLELELDALTNPSPEHIRRMKKRQLAMVEEQLQAVKEERAKVESATPTEFMFEAAQANVRGLQREMEELSAEALMLYPHSGRHGFDDIQPDAAVPTPRKEMVVAMLKRETELRNAAETQAHLDKLRRQRGAQRSSGEEAPEEQGGEPATLEAAKELIAALRSQLRAEKVCGAG